MRFFLLSEELRSGTQNREQKVSSTKQLVGQTLLSVFIKK